MSQSTPTSTTSEQRFAAAAMLLSQYSDSIGKLVDQVVGTSAQRDLQVLHHLVANSQQRPHELMVVTGLSRPGCAAVVARLEHLGLVRRTFGLHDRRTTLTSLTSAGRRRMSVLERALEDHFIQSGPLAVEILALLSDARKVPQRDVSDTALVVHCQLSRTLAAYEARVDGSLQAVPRRQQVAISTLMSWGLARPTQLAEALHLSSGGLTYVMDQLESDGIITRTYGGDDDRRAVVIQLSELGRECGRAMCSALEASAAEICSVLSLTLAPQPQPTVGRATNSM